VHAVDRGAHVGEELAVRRRVEHLPALQLDELGEQVHLRQLEERVHPVEAFAAQVEALLAVELRPRLAVEQLASEVGAADVAMTVHLEHHAPPRGRR
jgi:hypothetical protein